MDSDITHLFIQHPLPGNCHHLQSREHSMDLDTHKGFQTTSLMLLLKTPVNAELYILSSSLPPANEHSSGR